MADVMTFTDQSVSNDRLKVAGLVLGAVLLVAACDRDTVAQGISSLGSDFVKVFNQNPNDEPIQDVQNLNLTLTPTKEPFNP